MKIKLKNLKLSFKKSYEVIDFEDVTYFYGQMGAGKTSIVNLVDYCLGGKLEYSPALQQEFNSATLTLTVCDVSLSILRVKNTEKVIVETVINGSPIETVVPLSAGGEVIPETGVETLSDLIYFLSGVIPPKVRRSKKSEDTKIQRLSIRNLLWYCYLDQDHIDSNFFNLDETSDTFKKLQSRDVLRYIVGYHQEKVTEMEIRLQELRDKRRELNSASITLESALDELGVESVITIDNSIAVLEKKLEKEVLDLDDLKSGLVEDYVLHESENLKAKARYLATEIDALNESVLDVERVVERDSEHLSEIEVLKVKVKRDRSAREILSGITYETCPCCTMNLPARKLDECAVCGQVQENEVEDESTLVLEADANARITDLKASIANHNKQLKLMKRRLLEFSKEKELVDRNIEKSLKEYDSAFLSTVLGKEKSKLAIEEKIYSLNKLRKLPDKVNSLKKKSNDLTPEISELASELKACREEAEKDTSNLKKLEDAFLSCLVGSKMPGIKSSDSVEIKSPDFLPEVLDSNIGGLATTSFSNLSSGGKKTLYKCCFALAFHLLARKAKSNLPSLLIIDSPMKNISERENKDQFTSFLNLIYELADGPLSNTQFILVDKEFHAPPEDFSREMLSRHMQPNSKDHPPLIPYYQGH